MIDRARVCGRALIQAFKDGVLVHSQECNNLVTELGDTIVADRMGGSPSQSQPTHMAVGSGSGAVYTSTELVNEEARVALTSDDLGTGGGDNVRVYTASFSGGSYVVAEIALFNDATAGVMFNYLDGFSSFPITDLVVNVTLSIRFGSST